MEIINCYSNLPSKYQTKKDTYKNYYKIHIDLPSRITICGSSGSGKSNITLNLILGINAWDDIWLFIKCETEPLYAFLIDEIRIIEKKLGIQMLHVFTNIDNLPSVDSFDPKRRHLLVFDDVIADKESKLENVAAIWVRGRKQGITSMFLTQSFFLTPKLIRSNTSIFIFKHLLRGDCKRIMAQLAMSVDPDQMYEYYKKCDCSNISNFFMLDTSSSDKRYEFRNGFLPIEG